MTEYKWDNEPEINQDGKVDTSFRDSIEYFLSWGLIAMVIILVFWGCLKLSY